MHRNAPLTPEGRLRLCRRIEAGWTVAQAAGERSPDGMQRLLNQAVWDEGGVREDLRGLVVEHLGAPDGVLVFDETGDIKKGRLCRRRHKQPYADVRIMPTSVRSAQVSRIVRANLVGIIQAP